MSKKKKKKDICDEKKKKKNHDKVPYKELPVYHFNMHEAVKEILDGIGDIPKVDNGVRENKEFTIAKLEAYYEKNHIHKYVYSSDNGRCIAFEFTKLLPSNYDAGSSDEDATNGRDAVLNAISYGNVAKKSFMNNMNVIMRYINYFIEYFDDTDELLSKYLYMMFLIRYSDIEIDPMTFKVNVLSVFKTDSLIAMIIAMTEYNIDETMIKKSTNRTYDESIQLTIEHLKAIMCLGCIHKFIIPIVSIYVSTMSKTKIWEESGVTDKELYFGIFSGFIDAFDSYYDINLYNKLQYTATTRISKTANRDHTMWKRRERVGVCSDIYADMLMIDFLVDISQKVVFNKSAIVYIHVCFDKSIHNELIQQDKHEYIDIDMKPSDNSDEKPNRMDKWTNEHARESERDSCRAYISIKDMILNLGREYGLDFSILPNSGTPKKDNKEIDKSKLSKKNLELLKEYEYYRDNTPKFDNSQIQLITLYQSSKMQSSKDPERSSMSDIYKTVMLMKRDFSERNYVYLQYFINGELSIKKKKKTYNRKKVEKLVMNSTLYEDFCAQYGNTIQHMNMEKLIDEVKSILSYSVRVVDYDHCMSGKEEYELMCTDVCIIDEILRYFISL